MEDLYRKIPLICRNVFEELDNQSFVNFKDASREINGSMKNERFYWIRVLSTYNCSLGGFKDSWTSVVKRTPPEFVKELVMVTERFYEENPSLFTPTICLSPHHIAAGCGNLKLFKHFIERTDRLNPEEPTVGITPMHYAACNGQLEVCQFITAKLNVKNPWCHSSS